MRRPVWPDRVGENCATCFPGYANQEAFPVPEARQAELVGSYQGRRYPVVPDPPREFRVRAISAAVSGVIAELDRLRGEITGMHDSDRDAVTDRLRSMLRDLSAAAADDDELDNVTDDEMFALLDKELGLE